ncbi:MAG: pilin [Candidatus Komeilibacteria bacterium]|nr:pilin [Candidatus Komeilibacteria bacterium]
MTKLKKIIFYCLLWVLNWPALVFAQTETEQPLNRFLNIANNSGYTTNAQSKAALIVNIINYVLGFVGLFFFLMILISGFQWMSAGGNEEKVEAAKKRMASSIIGFAIILAAYSLTLLVNSLLNASLANTYL